MARKQLDTTQIANELQHSAFFPGASRAEELSSQPVPSTPATTSAASATAPYEDARVGTPAQSTETPDRASARASADARVLAPEPASSSAATPDQQRGTPHTVPPSKDVVEAIRRHVRHFGKDVMYVRLTSEEKEQLGDLVYSYKRQGIKTTENELSRIGINWMLEDYQEHKEESMLARVLEALNS